MAALSYAGYTTSIFFFSKSSSATWTKVKENGYHFDKVNQFRKGKNLQFSSGVCPTHVFGTICLRVGFKCVRKTITPTMHLGGSRLGGNGSSSHPGRKDLSVCLCFRNKVLVLWRSAAPDADTSPPSETRKTFRFSLKDPQSIKTGPSTPRHHARSVGET